MSGSRVNHAIDRRSTKICARVCATAIKSKDEPSSIKPEGHVLEAKGLRRVIFHLTVMLVMVGVVVMVVVVTMIRVLIFGF